MSIRPDVQRARTAPPRALRPVRAPAQDPLGWIRISGVGSALASPCPRLSIPRAYCSPSPSTCRCSSSSRSTRRAGRSRCLPADVLL